MTFDELVHQLEARLCRPLPGATAHEVLRAVPVSGVMPKFEHKLPPRPGSVLILLYPGEGGEVIFPLIKRPDYLGAHSGQVSLPGGKAEPGEDFVDTAVREAQEEIGVDPSTIKIIGRLSEFFVIPSNFKVIPVLGYATERPTFYPDAREVSRILEADLLSIVPEDGIKRKEILAAGQFRMIAPHFEIDGEVVWGATAMILNELRTCLVEIGA